MFEYSSILTLALVYSYVMIVQQHMGADLCTK